MLSLFLASSKYSRRNHIDHIEINYVFYSIYGENKIICFGYWLN